MTQEPRHRLAALLGDTRGQGTFSARRTAPSADLQIEVTDVGPIELPVTSAQARQLVAIARPARYGHGEQTLTDASVRDTWEVPKSRIKIDKRRWNRTLQPILDGIRGDLGLPDGRRLTTELHSVLVYTPGQFFVPHQDTEKSDDMIGTLTVALPGSSKGGELVIDHAGEQATYRSSTTLLSFVAFYADCRHEVRPVTSGYRVVLTYNLLLTGNGATERTPDHEGDLTACLTGHFANHDRLVYLLDHEYTQRGLSWGRLKGVDAQRVSVLRSAAEHAGCLIALALADVHETWNAYEPYDDGYDYRYGRPRRRPKDDEEYQLQDLIEKQIGLDSWVDADGEHMDPVATSVPDEEVCESTPNGALAPYESEYEGYLGNYGNTLDRWYHRGAVVLWPRDRDFAVRAEGAPTWALEQLAGLVRGGEPVRARELAASLGSFWAEDWGVRTALSAQAAFGLALEVAVGVADAEVATMLLRPIRLERFAPVDAPVLAALVDRYGQRWLRDLLGLWDPQLHGWYRDADGRADWVAAIPELIRPLTAIGGDGPARILIAESWGWLGQAVGRARRLQAPSHRARALTELAAPTAGLLVAAAAQSPTVVEAITQTLDDDDLGTLLGQVLRIAVDADPAAVSRFRGLFERASDRFRNRLANPIRDPTDWSIEPRGTCRIECRECRNLDAFLVDPARRTVAWPLSEQFRRHIEERIARHELPVDQRTIKSGRPYTIELTKSSKVFAREAQQRRDDQETLAWLESMISG